MQARLFSGVRIFYADVQVRPPSTVTPVASTLGAKTVTALMCGSGSKGSGFSLFEEGVITLVITVVVYIRDYALKSPLHPIVDEIDIHARAGIPPAHYARETAFASLTKYS
jgi:hypothetical protein